MGKICFDILNKVDDMWMNILNKVDDSFFHILQCIKPGKFRWEKKKDSDRN